MKLSPYKYFLPFCVLIFIIACNTTPKLKSVEKSMIELNAQNALTDSVFEKKISPYKTELDKIMNEVLVVSENEMLKGLPESSLGDFVSDAVLKKTNDVYHSADSVKANICLLNNGGLRAQLPKGNITRGNVFELMPFENSILVLTLSGEKTKQLFEYIVGSGGAPFAGATVKGKSKKITELKISAENFDEKKTYKVVTSDYLASGGDKYSFFANPLKVDTINYKLRDAIIDYMLDENKKGNKINAVKDGRIKLE